MGVISLAVAIRDGLLKTRISLEGRGALAGRIKAALEEPANWFIGQAVPVTVEEVAIRPTNDDQGELEIEVRYSVNQVSIETARSNLQSFVLPFQAHQEVN